MKVAIIGAGASGLVCALNMALKNYQVTVIDHNSDSGKKLLMTGSGRCNLGNVDQDLKHYHSSTPGLIEQVITVQNLEMVDNLWRDLGLVLKNKNGYLYPFSEKATSVKSVLIQKLRELNAQFCFDKDIKKIDIKEQKFSIDGEIYDKLVLATGGLSYPKTGTSSWGYDLAKQLGHHVVKPRPSLVALEIKDPISDWAGIRLEGIVSLEVNQKILKQEKGEIQLTKDGISGICVFNISRDVSKNIEENKNVTVSLNFVPWLTEDMFSYLNNLASKFPKRSISELCEGFIDYKLINALLKKTKIDKNKKWLELPLKEQRSIANLLTNFKVNIAKPKDMEVAQVTSGGISLTDVNLKTMESKIIPNLYFCGEILDLDGDCGGYNLTIAWITALLVGGYDDKNS